MWNKADLGGQLLASISIRLENNFFFKAHATIVKTTAVHFQFRTQSPSRLHDGGKNFKNPPECKEQGRIVSSQSIRRTILCRNLDNYTSF